MTDIDDKTINLNESSIQINRKDSVNTSFIDGEINNFTSHNKSQQSKNNSIHNITNKSWRELLSDNNGIKKTIQIDMRIFEELYED